MSAERRRRLNPDDRRAQLLALGVASLAEQPLDALSIEQLSAKAGVSRSLLFYYFGSRQGLHHAVVLAARDALLRATTPALELPPLDRLHDTLTRLVAFVREHRGTFFALVRGSSSADSDAKALIDEARAVNAERLLAAFLELGTPDSELLRVAVRAWVSFAEETLVDGAIATELPDAELVAFLQRSATAVVAAVAPAPHPAGG
ncbi:TetR/AcrR family transcriptional regulator [Galbitalea sp. SE-J8]|uniref:TetR/AcrR family transcriptional regulator n=1 Tax=Galbitalea sp. SE-J8 TaxID=3054952 RepID=UPI00259CAF0B|nr:TetR/AcrR family transcriptional regulator [Galbitalea sp. SE-J8]MDM4761738.1 TetR/AcrR family transcriptional regulator [Galbitalea sp. SE-J8]